jgi:hypothetical protein
VDNADIEQLLQGLQNEGTLHSTGRFTISLEKHREKLSQFSFERPSQWILKIIQALTVAQIESCKIQQFHHRTEIIIKSTDSVFSVEQMKQALDNPQDKQNEAIGHLMTALCYLSFKLGLTWAWKDQGSPNALIAQGIELTEITSIATDYATLQISHIQPKADGIWWAPLLKITGYKGPEACAEITRELNLHAYTCPFPLLLDGRRIDNLLRCSSQKPSSATQSTELIAPRGFGRTYGPVAPLRISHRLRNSDLLESDPADQIPAEAGWLALLFGHLRVVAQSYGNDYAAAPNPSRISWVRKGIVIAEEKLSTNSGASLHLFLSADHLKTDISGLKLIEERTKPHPEIMLDLLEWTRPESNQLSLQGKFQVLGIDDPQQLDQLIKKEISTLLRQLRPKSAIKEEPFTNLSQMLKQIQTDLHIEPS